MQEYWRVVTSPTAPELERIVELFTAGTLPHEEWTHRAHLVVGTWHVHTHGADAALDIVRAGILRLNAQHGTPNTDTRGYHETITRAYLTLIAAVLNGTSHPAAGDAVAAVLNGPVAAPDVLLRYYSKERLMSVAARRGWIEPDRERIVVGSRQ
jgi:hypothetical protein